jgi:hypothetical protein
MKFLAVLSLCFSSLFATLGYAQQADLLFDKPVTPLLLEYSSTGCPGCGSWGKPKSEALRAIHGNKLNHLEVHIRFNDPMENELTKTISENRPGRRFTPQFWINNKQATTLTSEGYLDSTMTFRNAATIVNAWYENANVPSIDAEVLKKDDKIEVVYGARFYSETLKDQDYYLACYLVRDGVMHAQKGQNGKVIAHNSVLTASADNAFGKKIEPIENQDTLLKATFDKPSDVESAIMIVMWHKNGMTYEAINSLRVD